MWFPEQSRKKKKNLPISRNLSHLCFQSWAHGHSSFQMPPCKSPFSLLPCSNCCNLLSICRLFTWSCSIASAQTLPCLSVPKAISLCSCSSLDSHEKLSGKICSLHCFNYHCIGGSVVTTPHWYSWWLNSGWWGVFQRCPLILLASGQQLHRSLYSLTCRWDFQSGLRLCCPERAAVLGK